jgi:hypothetical protein
MLAFRSWGRALRGSLIFTILGMALMAAPGNAALCDLLGTCKPPPPLCKDGADNDRDGAADLEDPGCTAWSDAWEHDDDAPDLGAAVMGEIPAGKALGFNTTLGTWDSGVTPQEEVALVRRAGGTGQRMFLAWRAIQPRGPDEMLNLGRTDALYAELVATGVKPVIGVIAAPAWAACAPLEFECQRRVRNGTINLPPRHDYIPAYRAFIAAIAKRYPRAAIETWNEPNYKAYWEVGAFPDAARMGRMQCEAYDAIKQARPGQTVVSPGLLWIWERRTRDGMGSGLLEYLRGMYWQMGRTCWDALAVHVYPGSRYDGPDSAPAQLLRLLRNVRPDHKDSTPIWIGEVGATTTGDGSESHQAFTEEQQAAVVNGAIGELLAAPEVTAVFVHTLRERPMSWVSWGSTQYGFGLLREADGPFPPPKPAYCVLVARAAQTYPGC